MITAISLLAAFMAGVITGGFGALKCVKFGVRASYEIRHGNEGLSANNDDVDAEFQMLDGKDKKDKTDE